MDKEELGSSKIHTRNGSVDDEANSEKAAFEMARTFLSFLPDSVDHIPARIPCSDPINRREETLAKIVPKDPRKVYKMRPIINFAFDKDSFFEVGKNWGKSVITGLARARTA